METRTDDRHSAGKGPIDAQAALSEIMRGSRFGRRQRCRGQTVTFIGKWRDFFGGIWQGRAGVRPVCPAPPPAGTCSSPATSLADQPAG